MKLNGTKIKDKNIKEKLKKIFKHKNFKLFINIFGYILVLISFYFIYLSIKKIDFSVLIDKINIKWIFYIAFFSVLYSLIFILQGICWNKILRTVSDKKINYPEVVSVYTYANIAKYIPGNIFGFVARHLIVRKYGVSDLHLVFINLIEIFFYLFTSITICIIGLAFGYVELPFEILKNVKLPFVILAVCIAAVLFIVLFLVFNKKIFKLIISLFKIKKIISFLIIILLYFIYFILSGVLTAFILKVFLNIDFFIYDVFLIISIFSLAWVLGYVVPGASGGIGIRELVFLTFLSPVIGSTNALIIAVISRLFTLFGEILAFVYGRIYKLLNKDSKIIVVGVSNEK